MSPSISQLQRRIPFDWKPFWLWGFCISHMAWAPEDKIKSNLQLAHCCAIFLCWLGKEIYMIISAKLLIMLMIILIILIIMDGCPLRASWLLPFCFYIWSLKLLIIASSLLIASAKQLIMLMIILIILIIMDGCPLRASWLQPYGFYITLQPQPLLT